MPRISKSRQLERLQRALEKYLGQSFHWYPMLPHFGGFVWADTPEGTISIMLDPPAGSLPVGGSYFKDRSELECLTTVLTTKRQPKNKSLIQMSLQSMKQ